MGPAVRIYLSLQVHAQVRQDTGHCERPTLHPWGTGGTLAALGTRNRSEVNTQSMLTFYRSRRRRSKYDPRSHRRTGQPHPTGTNQRVQKIAVIQGVTSGQGKESPKTLDLRGALSRNTREVHCVG